MFRRMSTQYCGLVFENAGMPVEEAIIVSDTLVEADLIGVESHREAAW